MAKYTLKRFASALVTILFVICVTFLLINSIPGGPWTSDKNPSKATVEALNEKYGLNKPPIVQLGKYLENLAKGDLGVSLKMQKNRPVAEIILEKFPVSAGIGFFALLWSLIAGIFLGSLAALKRGTWADSLIRVVCTVGVSMPSFVIASLLLTAFTGKDGTGGVFPVIFDFSLGFKSYILPCFALGLYSMCYIARQTRASMLDELSKDYIRTARAMGLSSFTVVFSQALKNAVIPVITFMGTDIALVFCGGFVVETVFSVPGLGRYFVQSIQNRDYPVILGTTVFLAAFIILMNFLADVLYKAVDPRIELTKGDR